MRLLYSHYIRCAHDGAAHPIINPYIYTVFRWYMAVAPFEERLEAFLFFIKFSKNNQKYFFFFFVSFFLKNYSKIFPKIIKNTFFYKFKNFLFLFHFPPILFSLQKYSLNLSDLHNLKNFFILTYFFIVINALLCLYK